MEHIEAYVVDLPCSIRGFVRKNPDDSYTILVNARLNYEMQITTYEHELSHIDNGDYDHDIQVDSVEAMRHYILA